MTTETIFIPAEKMPENRSFWWWFQTGDSGWRAPDDNNGAPYWPEMKIQWIRNLFWFFRNPLGNFIGFGLGVAGIDRTITGTAPVRLTTWRDARPPRTGWKWAMTNGKYPFASYWGGKLEFYIGWRVDGGGLGLKFAIRKDAYSDQPNYPTT